MSTESLIFARHVQSTMWTMLEQQFPPHCHACGFQLRQTHCNQCLQESDELSQPLPITQLVWKWGGHRAGRVLRDHPVQWWSTSPAHWNHLRSFKVLTPRPVSRIFIGLSVLGLWIVGSSLGESSVHPRLRPTDLNQARERRWLPQGGIEGQRQVCHPAKCPSDAWLALETWPRAGYPTRPILPCP